MDTPAPVLRPAGPRLDGPFGRRECRLIFREMVRAECRSAQWGAQRRRHLLDFTASLSIGCIDANRIIAEVQHELKAGGVPATCGWQPAARQDRACGGAVRSPALVILAGALLCSAWLIAGLL